MAQTGFTRKKVASLTLGEKLKKMRSDVRMSLADVSKATRIQVKYLEYLESGQYDKLPADVYVRGFVRNYARHLNIDEQVLMKLYEHERNIQINLGHGDVPKKTYMHPIHTASLVITTRSLAVSVIIVLIAGAFLYLYQEFRSFAGVPRLVIVTPMNGAVIETDELTVEGKTDKGARVSINNQPVFVDSQGDFSGKLLLQQGANNVTVVSVNRFDKEKSETVSVEARYTPLTSETQSTVVDNQREAFTVQVGMQGSVGAVTVEADGAVVFSGSLKSGEWQTVTAKDQVKIIAENGDKALVRFKGLESEPLLLIGASKNQAVVFTSEGRQK
ncbi:MAG: helix-turn-helix domain-containing protein [Minisyncoccota bacterium]